MMIRTIIFIVTLLCLVTKAYLGALKVFFNGQIELFLLFYENCIVINLATYRKIFWDYYIIEDRKRDSKLCHKLITTGTVIVRIILWFKREGKFNFIRDFHL